MADEVLRAEFGLGNVVLGESRYSKARNHCHVVLGESRYRRARNHCQMVLGESRYRRARYHYVIKKSRTQLE